jgi:uncharacterized protein
VYTDSLNQNGRSVFYRLIGITAFSEEGPASEVLEGEGVSRLGFVPYIVSAIPDEKGVLEVTWEFDARGHELLSGFELQRSDQAKGPFTSVVNNIPAATRKVTYDKLESTNYFTIRAIPRKGNPTVSFPVLVQPIDSVPPIAPTGLTGIIDTAGIVKLNWTSNQENDIYGYRIFRGNTRTEELVPLTHNAVTSTHWTDTIDVYNLNTEVFYAITALDKRYNQSPKSTLLTITKPDVVVPSSPLITDYKVSDNGIVLTWVTGNEENLGSINIMRADGQDKPMEIIHKISTLATTTYKDSVVVPDRYYRYAIVSVTKYGLVSVPSPAITIQAPPHAEAPERFSALTPGKTERCEASS